MEFYLVLFFIFFLGAIFGSFLNVLSVELEPLVFWTKKEREKKKIKNFWDRINRRSACPHCHKKLEFLELIPIFSWLFLAGKCSNCKVKISPRYFFVELFAGSIFLGFFWFLAKGINPENILLIPNFIWLKFLLFIPIISSRVLIFLFDWKHKIIPDIVIIPAIIYSFIFIFFDFQNLSFVQFSEWWETVYRSIIFALPFFALWFFSKGRAMGFADWKLVFFLSLFLKDYWDNLLFVFGAFWIGAIYSIPLLLFKKNKLKTEIPFGPFIILSFLFVFISEISYFQFVDFFRF